MLDDEDAIEQLKGRRRHGEEVEGDDHLAVILEESQPALGGVAATPNAPRIPSHGSFGDDGAKLQKLSVDFGSAPTCILFCHPAEGRPEESVQRVQYWPRPFALEHGDLLPKSEDFEGSVAPSAEEDAESGQD